MTQKYLEFSWRFDIQSPLIKKEAFNASYFDEIIPIFMKERYVPGLSVALTYDDRLIYASGFGYADKEHDRQVENTDRFRLASVSKSITAISIMHLVQEGVISLSDRVFGHNGILGFTYGTKVFSPWELEITVQHLLEHTTGFVNEDMCGEKDCDPTYLPEYLALDQWHLVSAVLDQYDPSHQPGTFASYSNFAYFVAGRVVEAASGVKPYEKFVKDEILTKLGIEDMEIAMDDRRDDEVVYYDPKEPEHPYNFHVNRRDSVGAWIATPVSLVKILTAVDGLYGRPDILNATTRHQMFDESPVKGSAYAKGWTVRHVGDAVSEAFKDGGYWGTNAYVNINFLNKTSFAIIVNQEIPYKGSFKGGHDLKTLMDNLTFGIEEWPDWDLF
jgi:CubicO group peptidase (beta-lactamase class C family)